VSITHYMELLMTNQPWNLIIYMAIPVILAEALVATEFFVVHTHQNTGTLRTVNKWLGVVAGIYFLGIFLNLITNVVPGIEWRGWVDVVAVGFYLSGVIPLVSIALIELGVLGRGRSDMDRMKLHFIFLTVFLVVAHIAMIFGMVSPELVQVAPSAMPMM